MMTRRDFLHATPAVLAAAMAAPSLIAAEAAALPPEIGRSSRPVRSGDGVAVLDLGNRKAVRVLQITDNHFFAGVKSGLTVTGDDDATERDWQSFVRIFKPDLVVATGDLWHDNPGGRGHAAQEHSLRRLSRLGVPWAVCWGNHDQLDDYQRGHDAFESAERSLYRGGATHGDYRIDLRVAGSGGAARTAARLFLMNSNDAGLGAWQTAWLRREHAALKEPSGAVLPAIGFFHIPVLEQKTLFKAGATPGVCNEAVCHEQESGGALPGVAAAGSIRATFCGHDHTNDYAVRGRDVDLVYGRATGYSGYGGEKVKKGAKLIELDLVDGRYTQVTVFADGSRWKPA